MLTRSRMLRLTLVAALVVMALASIGAISQLPDAAAAQPAARDATTGIAPAPDVIRPARRLISVPFGINMAILDGDTIIVKGHDGTTGENAVDPTEVCPDGNCTADIRVFVRDLDKPGTFARGNWHGDWPTGNGENGDEWTATTDIQTNHAPFSFEVGDSVRVCAIAQIRTDGPGAKGRVVGLRQWCKTVDLTAPSP